MRQKSGPQKRPAEEAISDIRRATRRHFSAEEKIRVVLEGPRGEESVGHDITSLRDRPAMPLRLALTSSRGFACSRGRIGDASGRI